MLDTCRLASYVPKGKEKQAMKQQKAMLIALIVICLTVIVTALVTRKDLCEVRLRTARRRSLSSQLTNLRSKRPGEEKSLATSDVSGILNAPALNPLRRVYFICKYFYKNNAHTQHKTKSITDKKGA